MYNFQHYMFTLQIDSDFTTCSSCRPQHHQLIKTLRDISHTFLTHHNGQFILLGRTEFKFLLNLEFIKEFSVPFYFGTCIKSQTLFCSIQVSDYKIRQVISETGYGIFHERMNYWNLENKQARMILTRKNDIIVTQNLPLYANIPNMYSNYLKDSSEKLKQFLAQIILKTSHFSKLVEAKFSNFRILRKIFDSNIRQRHKQPSLEKIEQITPFMMSPIIKITAHSQKRQNKSLFQELTQKIANYQLKEIQCQPILSLITIKKRMQIEQQKITSGCNSSIQNFYFEYTKYITDFSMNADTHDLLNAKNPGSGHKNSLFHDSTDESEEQLKKLVQNLKRKNTSFQNKIKDSKSQIKNKSPEKIKEQIKVIECSSILVQKKPLSVDPIPFQIEFQVLKYLRNSCCPYIASYYFTSLGIQSVENSIYIDFYPFNIVKHLKTPFCFPFIFKLIKGISFLQSYELCHRDLKINNVMVDPGCNPRIIDFGSSNFEYNSKLTEIIPEQRLRTTRIFNKVYEEAPKQIQKIFSKQEYERHRLFDVYAFGKIVNVLLEKYQIGRLLEGHLSYIVSKCREENPDDRLTPNEIIIYLQQLHKCQLNFLK